MVSFLHKKYGLLVVKIFRWKIKSNDLRLHLNVLNKLEKFQKDGLEKAI